MTRIAFIIIGLIALSAPQVVSAGFVVSMLQIDDGVSTHSEIDFETVSIVSNPLNHDSLAQIGMNIVESTYAFQWNETAGTGEFDTDLSHAIRSLNVSTVTRVQVFIEPTEDLRATIEGSISYSHTTNQEIGVLFGMAIRDFGTSRDAFHERLEGGVLYNEPSTGTLDVGGEAILYAGALYRLQLVLDCTNIAESNVGNLDASGFANFRLEPLVPEPTTALLLALAAASIGARRRRRVAK
ncbi:MAG TPA: PEP-CTERM sorting domain-containing protein [Phycisphaerae bacterium]|nr:PEP-CTERM sorting domain-containing protein [Phycisphaerae bacterium]HRW52903.1 PEP-CTERM sorting domain-containing protein [Phycisphaerae bacterium]